MKKHIVLLALMFVAIGALSAQDELFVARLTKEKVPAVVITSVEKDFPDATITEYRALPVTILEEGWVFTKEKPMDGQYETYYLTVKGKNFDGQATYNADGNLVSFHEWARDVALPLNIARAIAREYPGWSIDKDHMTTTFYRNGKQKTYYHVNLSKGAEHGKVVFDSHGNAVKYSGIHGKEKTGKDMKKMHHDEG